MTPIRLIYFLIIIALFVSSNHSSAEKLTSINSIQGTNNTSPLINQLVTIEGIVTANFQNEKNFSGFFIQQRKSHPNQSSGIFIYENRKKVKVGDLVRITGLVSEHKDVTQLSKVKSLKILKSKQKLPEAIAIDLPLKKLNLEHLEGMRVTLNKPALITDHYNYIRFGEFTVSSKILMNPTNTVLPGKQAKLKKKENAKDRLLIDDGSFSQFVNYKNINSQSPVHLGAKVQVVGVMHYAFNNYRVELTQPVQYLDSPYSKQSEPSNIKGQLKIASFNLKNYFTTLDNGKTICGPKKNFKCRGADSAKEFERQQAKLVRAINTANADIFALQELENNKNSLKSLVDALNKESHHKNWHYIKTGTLGEDVIRVGLIYQKHKISSSGKYKVLDPKVMPDFEADKNRDVLLQTFKDSENNLFNIAVLHLKSKRCNDAVGDDRDQKDGQSCFNTSRVKVAQQISQWLAKNPTNQKAKATIILGDFNSNLKEDPLTYFEKNGYNNLTSKFIPKVNWTSLFRGEVGTIDHVLINNAASKAAVELTQWHINSSVQGWFDYNLEELTKSKAKPKDYYDSSPFASSDHDMVIVGFSF